MSRAHCTKFKSPACFERIGRDPSGLAAVAKGTDESAHAAPEEREALKERLSKEYAEKFASPYQTAASGSLDEVVEPGQMRHKIIRAFKFLRDKRRPGDHVNRGNIPL